MSQKNIEFCKPVKKNASGIFSLVRNSGVLDVNSEYLYLLQTTHFASTSAVALDDNNVVGFVTGYLIPEQPDALFVWQVGVDANYRGQNIAGRLIENILQRDNLSQVQYIHTTVSPSNASSLRLFEKLASHLKCEIKSQSYFELEDFLDAHEEEVLYTIGPFNIGQ